jgi:hypothetical protein
MEIDFNYDYSVFDIAFIESDVIIKLISDCLSLKNMKFHQKRPIKHLSHHLKEYALKNPNRIQTFVLISGDFVESMLEN